METGLPEESSLLVAEVTCYGNAFQNASAVAVNLRGRTDARQHEARHAYHLEHLRVPVQGFKVHQHRTRSIGDIGDVNASIRSTCQVPDDPGVDVAKK